MHIVESTNPPNETRSDYGIWASRLFFLEIHPMGIDLNTSDLHKKHKFLCGHVEIGHSLKKKAFQDFVFNAL